MTSDRLKPDAHFGVGTAQAPHGASCPLATSSPSARCSPIRSRGVRASSSPRRSRHRSSAEASTARMQSSKIYANVSVPCHAGGSCVPSRSRTLSKKNHGLNSRSDRLPRALPLPQRPPFDRQTTAPKIYLDGRTIRQMAKFAGGECISTRTSLSHDSDATRSTLPTWAQRSPIHQGGVDRRRDL